MNPEMYVNKYRVAMDCIEEKAVLEVSSLNPRLDVLSKIARD